MNHDLLQRVLQCPTLPTPPAVAVKILDLAADPDVSIDALADAIAHDQALAAKILRTVNSSFYALRAPCSTVSQAVVMLGLRAVKSLALGFSLVASINAAGRAAGFDFKSYWRRALYAAVAARCAARTAGIRGGEEAFLAALLQDIGMVALHQALGEEYTRVLNTAGTGHAALASAEAEAFGIDHAAIGALLAEHWKLPPELALPIRYHEIPTAAPAELAESARCVAFGCIAHDVLSEDDPTFVMARFFTRAQEWFGLDRAAAEGLLRRIGESIREVTPLFQITTGPHADADAILAKARERLEQFGEQPQPDPSQQLSGLVADGAGQDALTGALTLQAMIQAIDSAAGQAPLSAVCVALRHHEFSEPSDADADAMLVETFEALRRHAAAHRAGVARSEHGAFFLFLPATGEQAAARHLADVRLALMRAAASWPATGRNLSPSFLYGSATLDNPLPETPGRELLARAARSAATTGAVASAA